MAPWVLLDDTAFVTNFDILGGGWTRSNSKTNQAFNSTFTSWNPGAPHSGIPSELELFYFGADLNFYGTINTGVAVNYTIDGSTQRPVPFPAGVADGKTGINLLSLPGLTDSSSHTVHLFPVLGQFTLDYVTYIPNSLTLLTGTNLLLDDDAPELQYSGQWKHTTGDFKQGRPHNGTMSGTNVLGSTMQVTFEGSSISVYGLLNDVNGRLSCSFVLDSATSTATEFSPFDGQQQNTDPSSWMLSQQFFHQDLSPGQHTLLINLTDVSSQQMLWIDYIVYEGISSTRLTTPLGTSPGTTSFPDVTKNPSFPTAAIAGIAVGAFIFSIILLRFVRMRLRPRPTPPIVISTVPLNTSVYEPPPPIPAPAPVPPPVQYGQPVFNLYNNQYMPPPVVFPPQPQPPQPTTYQPPYEHATPFMPQPGQDMNASNSEYTSTPSTTELTADNYYVHDAKGDTVKLQLQWNSPSSSNDGSNATKNRNATSNNSLPTQFDGAFPALAHSTGTGGRQPSHSDGSNPTEYTENRVPDGAATGRSYSPSNHAHEDGRDDDGVPVEDPEREMDAGPAMFPPAYDDRLYS